MGSSASKSARKLPTTAPSRAPPSWAGARTPPRDPIIPDGLSPPPPSSGGPGPSRSTTTNHDGSAYSYTPSGGDFSGVGRNRGKGLEYGLADQGAEPGSTGRAKAGFSGEKDDAVLRDARDPQFMSNLSRLGQVKIQDAGQFIPTPAPAQRTLNSRSPDLTTPTQLPPAGHLTAPLLSSLLDKLKSLPPGGDAAAVYREYNMDPSTMEGLRRWVNSPSVGEDEVRVEEGERIVEMRAIWVDGKDKEARRISA